MMNPFARRQPSADVAPEMGDALIALAVEAEHICDGLKALAAALEANTKAQTAVHEAVVLLANGDRQALGRVDRLCQRLDRLLDHLEAP